MKVDYIVVGCGLAGIAFCEQLKQGNKSFVVFDNNSQLSSLVAGGLYNPIVLKRFTPVWKSKEQLEKALPMYLKLEEELNVKLDYKIPVRRRFTSIEEQNNWFTASDKLNMSQWMSPKIIKNNNPSIDAEFGFGEVLCTGRIDTSKLIKSYRENLKENNNFYEEEFCYDKLMFDQGFVTYNTIQTKHIVFAEGYGIKQNPYFNNLPLREAKGELLIIEAPDLNINYVLKSNVFLIPLGSDQYIVGATYNWKDKTNKITNEAKVQLLDKLKRVLKCQYKVVGQLAGIRPTVIDRRPLVGVHQKLTQLFVINGLGTRGVMIAPYIAEQLYNFIENRMPLDQEIDISRF